MITAGMIRSGQIVQGQTLYHATARNADGTPARWRVTSIKLWKRKPGAFELGLKRGMYQFAKIGTTVGLDRGSVLYASEQEALDMQTLEALP